MDYNNDGKKDLVVGELIGAVRVFINVNTDADPVFDKYVFLKIGFKNIDVGDHSAPDVVDWNNDGKNDLVIGGYDGNVRVAINEGTAAAPVYTSLELIQDGSADLDVSAYSSPCVVDFNRDGKKDLLCGEYGGTIFYFENLGTDENPLFNGSQKLKAGGTDIDVGICSRIDAADWDGDGVMDLLCGSSVGNVYHFHALGPLSIGDNWLSAATGGVVDFSLAAGSSNQGRSYYVLGSVSGTEPGLPLPGGMVTLPLNWDVLTDITVSQANGPALVNTRGLLDGAGAAGAQLNTHGPLPPNTVGATLYFSYLLYYPGIYYPYDYVSNPVAIEILL